MKVIFTLVPFMLLSIFMSAQSTYRWVNGNTALNAADNRALFLRSSNWRLVNANGTLGTTAVTPPTGSILQVYGVTITVSNSNLDLRSFRFDITIAASTTANGLMTYTGGTDLRLGNNSVIRVRGRSMGVGSCLTGAISLSDNSEIRIYNADSSAHNRVAENANGGVATRTLTANCTSGSSSYISTGYITPFTNANDNFSGFLASAAGPLPMRLGDFTATRHSQGVLLRWTTVQEVNSDNFEIQQSTDAQNWKIIGTVKAAGSSGSVLNYQFEDNSVNSGVVFYRLKMNDLDTKFEFSSVARIQFGAGSKKLFAYPSPATTYTTISTEVSMDGAVTVLIYEMSTGRMVLQKVVNAAGNSFRLGLEGLQSGTYTLQLIKDREMLGRVNLMKQ
jgi:hypothetical protein